MQSKLNLLSPERNVNQGVWIDRDFDTAKKVYDEFVYKIERENRFLQMLHLGVADIRILEQKARGVDKLSAAKEASMEYRTNLVGYMLT